MQSKKCAPLAYTLVINQLIVGKNKIDNTGSSSSKKSFTYILS